MATPAPEVGEFNLIITAHDPAQLAVAAKEFAAVFQLDEDVATQVIKSAPINFAQKLTKTEVKAVSPKLTALSNKGLEFRITSRLAGKMPKLNWPIRPQFTAADSGAMLKPTFAWDNNAFVCPGCGETFLFKRLGQIQLSDPAPTTTRPAINPTAAKIPATRVPEEPSPVGEAELDVQAEEVHELAPLEPMSEEENQPLPGEGEPIDLPDTVEEIRLDEIETEPASFTEEPAEPVEAEEVGGYPAGSDGDQYNVFLSKIVDRTKVEKAVELITKMKGINADEARELTTRLVIPIAKGIGQKDAEKILEQFKKHKIFGRMTKVK